MSESMKVKRGSKHSMDQRDMNKKLDATRSTNAEETFPSEQKDMIGLFNIGMSLLEGHITYSQ